jgi:hypothetical protein
MSDIMRIRIVLNLDVDAEVWAEEYGVARANVRSDVQRYIRNGLQDHFDSVGTPARVVPNAKD